MVSKKLLRLFVLDEWCYYLCDGKISSVIECLLRCV